MLSAYLAVSLLGALAVSAAPAERNLEKRHSHCFSYNTAGCQYPTVGKKGAVVTVRGSASMEMSR